MMKDISNSKRGKVFVEEIFAGIIEEREGLYIFTGQFHWWEPPSFTLGSHFGC